jgi:hypothetical protein
MGMVVLGHHEQLGTEHMRCPSCEPSPPPCRSSSPPCRSGSAGVRRTKHTQIFGLGVTGVCSRRPCPHLAEIVRSCGGGEDGEQEEHQRASRRVGAAIPRPSRVRVTSPTPATCPDPRPRRRPTSIGCSHLPAKIRSRPRPR